MNPGSFSVLLLIGMSLVFYAKADQSDIYKNISEIVTSHGYKFETHEIKTEDCYFLTVFRISGKKDESKIGAPVLLQHGFIDSADGWVAHDKESPAF
jgi:hypothetical protein